MARNASSAGPYTAETVRRDLPDVTVAHKGKVYPGRIAGVCLDFAIVTWGDGRREEWAWSSIAHALNAGKPLIA